jgi:hypothetical protein
VILPTTRRSAERHLARHGREHIKTQQARARASHYRMHLGDWAMRWPPQPRRARARARRGGGGGGGRRCDACSAMRRARRAAAAAAAAATHRIAWADNIYVLPY